MRRIGFPTRERNSSHASSSPGPAQRQTTSFSERDEYRVGLEVFDIDIQLSFVKECACQYPVFHSSKSLLEISQNGRQKTTKGKDKYRVGPEVLHWDENPAFSQIDSELQEEPAFR
jgi:hypothetical protein